jgi:hypothetical protein
MAALRLLMRQGIYRSGFQRFSAPYPTDRKRIHLSGGLERVQARY